jgi:hypothetical protein
MRRGLIIAGFAVLAAVAVLGWTRKAHLTPSYFGQPGCEAQALPTAFPNQGMALGYPAMYVPVMPVMYAPAQGAAPVYTQGPVRTQRLVSRQPVPVRTVVHRQRPFSHSLAIVAGGAGAGAAIGGIAKGGKGAAIGALSGGTAAFIYDRLTHNR